MSEQTVGISRVIELENILGEILDEYEMGNLVPMEGMDEDGVAEIDEIYVRAAIILAREDGPEED